MIAGAFSLLGVRVYKHALADKRKETLRVQFKDMLYSISSAIAAGRHLNEAIMESEKTVSLINGEECILAAEIRNMSRKMLETNCTADDVLRDLSLRSKVKEISDFADVCIICQRTGGDLTKMISKAVMLLTQNIELQKEKNVMLSQKKTESIILAVMPVLVTALINIAAPDYLSVMYTTLAGRLIMTAALASTIISFLWSTSMIQSRVHM